jgi:hypothetical protein
MDQRNFKSIKNIRRLKKGFLVRLERGASNPEGGPESTILQELNPPMNRRIPQRNQEIATKGRLSMGCS